MPFLWLSPSEVTFFFPNIFFFFAILTVLCHQFIFDSLFNVYCFCYIDCSIIITYLFILYDFSMRLFFQTNIKKKKKLFLFGITISLRSNLYLTLASKFTSKALTWNFTALISWTILPRMFSPFNYCLQHSIKKKQKKTRGKF